MDPGGLVWDFNRKGESKMMKLKKAPFVHTHKTQEELNEYFDMHNNEEKRMLYLGSALTWNMIAHMLEQEE